MFRVNFFLLIFLNEMEWSGSQVLFYANKDSNTKSFYVKSLTINVTLRKTGKLKVIEKALET